MRHRSRLARNDGVAALEFGLVGLVFLALLFGSIEIGRVIWVPNSLSFVAEEAARWALARSGVTNTQVHDYAQTRLSEIRTTGANITVTSTTTAGIRYVLITVTKAFTPVTPLVSIGTLTVTGQARMPIS